MDASPARPRWLDRVLPDVDVEGEKLRHLLDDVPADQPVVTAEHSPT